MLPKDYLAYKLTGVHSTDYSDASGMLLLDVQNKCWSKEMCEICSVKEEWLPKLFESYERIGQVCCEYNLPNAIVTAGAGDNAAAAIGTGTVKNGECNISLGTSGTIFIAQDDFSVDENNSLHSFAHATGKYHLMGCILSAASCNKWWMEEILQTKNFEEEQEKLEELLGENDVYFLPYLMGERSPHNDVNARGCLIGIYDCGQAGIVGHLGCVYSTIEHNHIYNIAIKHEFWGYEIAGIKFHGAIDSLITNNNIHNCTLGIWLDWEAQGSRLTKNIFHKNNRDLMVEVCHGPCLIDHNVFTAEYAFDYWAQGSALVHNIFCGKIRNDKVLDKLQHQVAVWSPYFPNLYDVEIFVYKNGVLTDKVGSYFGLRDYRAKEGKILLNEVPFYAK